MRNPTSLPILERRALDNSIGGTLGRCARLGFYNYAINRSHVARNYPISFGSAYHLFREHLELLYIKHVLEGEQDFSFAKFGIKSAATSIAIKNWQDPPIEHKKSYLDLKRLKESFDVSFESWVFEKEHGLYKVIATESPFSLELPGWWRCSRWTECGFICTDSEEVELDGCYECDSDLERRVFTGKFDQILEWNSRLWVRDFKTTGRKVDFAKKYNPDHQFTGYTWAAMQLSNRAIDGTIVDILYNTKTKGPDQFPAFASRSSGDIEHWLEWIHDKFFEWESRIRSGIWPMQTTECDHYGMCGFREACVLGDWYQIEEWLKDKTVHSVWDPLNPDLEVEDALPEG